MAVNNNPDELNSKNTQQAQEFNASVGDVDAGVKRLSSTVDTTTRQASRIGASFEDLVDSVDDATDGIKNFEKTLNLLPEQLHSLTETMNKNMAYVSGDLKDSFLKGVINEKMWSIKAELGRETEELRIAAENAKKALEVAQESNDEQAQASAQRLFEQTQQAYQARKNMTDSQKLNKKLAYNMKTELLKIGKQMFSDLWNYAKKILDEAYSKDKSTIEQSYTTVMSYNSYNQGEYAKLIDRLQEKLDASGLGDTISVNTLQENLVKTLQTGLQGQLAESNAYYASVAEKAGITFDWYGTEWTQLISQMSAQGKDYEKLMQSMITVTDDLAEYYGDSTGLAQGKAQIMNSYASSIGTTYGLDADAISNIYKSYAVTSQELSKYGIDSSNIMQDITKVLESGINNDEALLAFATNGMTAEDVKAQLKAGNFDSLVTNYMQNAENMFKDQNGEMIKALTSGLGGSFSEKDYHALQTYWDQNGSFTDNFNKAFSATGSSIDAIEGELSNYITEQESYETRMENYLADIAESMVQNPVLEVISKTLQSGLAGILSILTTYLMNKSLLRSIGNGTNGNVGNSNLFSSIGTKGGALASKTKTLFTNGAQGLGAGKAGSIASKITSSKAGSMIFSTGGKVLGAAGSLISMGIDGYNGYKEDGLEGAFRGAITGSGKAAESGWDVAKGVGSGALKGAGIGMVFGPLGAAIGGAVGGLAGLAVGLHDLNDEEKKYQRSIEKARKSFSDLDNSIKDTNTKLAAIEDTNKAIKTQRELLTELELGKAPSKELFDSFPQYKIYLDKNGNATEEYRLKILDAIETQEKLNEIEKNKLLKESSDDIYGKTKEYNRLIKDVEEKQSKLDSANNKKAVLDNLEIALANAKDVEFLDDGNILSIDGVDYNVSDLQKSLGLDDLGDDNLIFGNTILSQYGSNALDKGVLRFKGTEDNGYKDIYLKNVNGSIDFGYYNDDGEFIPTGVADTSLNAYEYNRDNFEKDVINATSEYNKAASDAESAQSTRRAWVYSTVFDWGLDEIDSAEEFKKWQDNNAYSKFKDYFGTKEGSFKNNIENYNSFLKAEMNLPNADIEKIKSEFGKVTPSKIKEYFNEVNPNNQLTFTPAFATGTTYVPYDNYLALLHRGEQVRTAAEVAVERAEQHVASTDATSALNDVVLNQTNTIIAILTNIYNVLKTGSATSTAEISKLSYDLPGL